MGSDHTKFRLRLNLFDAIVLLLALAVGALLLWNAVKPEPPQKDASEQTGVARFTVRLSRWPEGTVSLVRLGDRITDNVNNRPVGEVVDVEAGPCLIQTANQETRKYLMTAIEGYNDVLLTIESPCTLNKYGLTVGEKKYPLRVGNAAYLRGEGYMGSGVVESIEIIELFEGGREVEQ